MNKHGGFNRDQSTTFKSIASVRGIPEARSSCMQWRNTAMTHDQLKETPQYDSTVMYGGFQGGPQIVPPNAERR